MAYEPQQLARADQHWAGVRAHLNDLVECHAEGATDIGNPESLDMMVDVFCCPHMENGQDVGRERHASTLAMLLTCAIDQLAALKAGAR